ncbi:MAG: hypothetical protein Ct9H90mP16_13190 [Candidatus Poseidoniales archaeon]|nr:MAG: hypothetical protein Ct9H90mP16_13190 [Candidatus Poseidoniales archaeon]
MEADILPINHAPHRYRGRASPSGDVLYTVWNPITVGIDRVLIIARIVLWIGTIDVFLAIPYTSGIGIGHEIICDVSIHSSIPNDTRDECHRATGIVLKVIVQQVAIRIEIIVTRFHWIGPTHDLIVVIDTVAI